MAEWLFIALFFCKSAYSKVCMLHLSAFIPISLFFTLRWEFEKSRDVWQRLCRSFPLIIFFRLWLWKILEILQDKVGFYWNENIQRFQPQLPRKQHEVADCLNKLYYLHICLKTKTFNLMWTFFGDVRHSSFLASAKHSGYTVEVTSSGAFTLTSKKAEPKVGHL